jgi:hypothetical protein
MKVEATMTIGELMTRFPDGFSVGPGTAQHPGELSQIIYATSHFRDIISNFAMLDGNRGYLVVNMDADNG